MKKITKIVRIFSVFLQKNDEKKQYYDTFRDIYDTVTFEGLFLLKLSWNKNIF